MIICPVALKQAREFVQDHHRHHNMPVGGLWAIGLIADEEQRELLGVAIAGRPVSRVLDRQGYCEVIRVCVLPEVPNGCSRLLGRVRRIAQLMGYKKTITYTLESEGGASLRAAGFVQTLLSPGGSWDTKSRRRTDDHPLDPKVRWEAA